MRDVGIIAERLRERMDAVGTNPNRLSTAIASRDAVRMILSGRSKQPRADTLRGLARELKCDVRYLLGEIDDPGEPAEPQDSPGARLRAARRKVGLTAEALAERVGRTPSAVRNQENGTNGIPPALAALYGAALGIQPEWILFGGDVGLSTPSPATASAAPATLTALGDGNARLTLNAVVPFSTALQILALVEEASK